MNSKLPTTPEEKHAVAEEIHKSHPNLPMPEDFGWNSGEVVWTNDPDKKHKDWPDDCFYWLWPWEQEDNS